MEIHLDSKELEREELKTTKQKHENLFYNL